MTIHEARLQLTDRLQSIYDTREAANITDWVLEHLTGWKKIDRIVHKDKPLSPEQDSQLAQYIIELLTHKPIQYVLHEAWFDGMRLYVDENVLIPRPETEELVEWIVKEKNAEYGIQNTEARSQHSEASIQNKEEGPTADSSRPLAGPITDSRILDIGTGSGCIPIALKKHLPATEVFACDVSEGALNVAKNNAATQQTSIEWLHYDFLNTSNWQHFPQVNIIVSNPPYIPVKDKATMQENVLQHEPHLALFVENDDPLLFYRSIAAFAKEKLLPGGSIYVEIHEDLGEATQQLFLNNGFSHAEIRKDMQGKDRMVKAKI